MEAVSLSVWEGTRRFVQDCSDSSIVEHSHSFYLDSPTQNSGDAPWVYEDAVSFELSLSARANKIPWCGAERFPEGESEC